MPTFVEEIRAIAGVDLDVCSSCASCRVPVPLRSALDVTPDDLVRLILDDKRDVVFASKTIWLLSGCMGRSIVCEKGVPLGKALAAVRKLALDAEIEPAEPDVAHLLETIAGQVRHSGRVHLRGILSEMRRHLEKPATEREQEFTMMLGGRLRLRSQKVKNMPAVRRALEAHGEVSE